MGDADMRAISSAFEREVRQETRRVEMEQLKTKVGMAGMEARTFAEHDAEYDAAPPLRFSELASVVDELVNTIAALRESLTLGDRALTGEIEQTEKRLLGDARSTQERNLIHLATIIMGCVGSVQEATVAATRINDRIGS